jgi:hypothetical protein
MIAANSFGGMVLRAISSERSNTVIADNIIQTTLDPGLPGGFQGINIRDFNGREQRDVTITHNMIGGTSGFAQALRVGLNLTQPMSNIAVTGNDFACCNELQVVDAASVLDINAVLAANAFDRAVVVESGGIIVPASIFADIQDAIDAAGTGDIVRVGAGTYVEDLTIAADKTGLELAGADDLMPGLSVIQGVASVDSALFPLAVPNIEIVADQVGIHGFTIRGPAPTPGRYASGMVIGGSHAEVHHNAFEVTNAHSLDDVSQGLQTYRDGSNPTGGDLSGLVEQAIGNMYGCLHMADHITPLSWCQDALLRLNKEDALAEAGISSVMAYCQFRGDSTNGLRIRRLPIFWPCRRSSE